MMHDLFVYACVCVCVVVVVVSVILFIIHFVLVVHTD